MKYYIWFRGRYKSFQNQWLWSAMSPLRHDGRQSEGNKNFVFENKRIEEWMSLGSKENIEPN